jgi:hypothetical protein
MRGTEMKTQRKSHHVEAYKNKAWNVKASVEWNGTEYSVRAEPITPSPYFLRREPQKFSTLELALGHAKAIAGVS